MGGRERRKEEAIQTSERKEEGRETVRGGREQWVLREREEGRE